MLAFFAVCFFAQGCASVPVERESLPPRTYIRIHVENSRIHDLTDPHLYLVGAGRLDLGIVRGMGGHLDTWVDERYLEGDRGVTIVAHYPGYGDLVFQSFIWRPGETLRVDLVEPFNPVAAWSLRE